MRQAGALLALLFSLVRPELLTAEPAGTASVTGERDGAAVARRLDGIADLVTAQKWTEVVDEYHALLTSAGDTLVAVSPDHWVQVRWLCHARLATLPPALKLFRERVAAQARKDAEAGLANRDARLLRHVVEDDFGSPFAETALDTLGDLAFEQGRFAEAEHWWRLLSQPASFDEAKAKDSLALVFTDPKGDLAQYRAKQILARLFLGDFSAAAAELKAFRAHHGMAEGQLAGRQGIYADILQALLEQPGTLAVRSPLLAWPTFGGDASRNGVRAALPDDPNWLARCCQYGAPRRISLDAPGKLGKRDLGLAFHPIIVGRQVVVAGARSLTVYDVESDTRQTWDLKQNVPTLNLDGLDTDLPARPNLHYTVTASGNRIYARLGLQALDPAVLDPPRDLPRDPRRPDLPVRSKPAADSCLVCLELQAGQPPKLLPSWPIKPGSEDKVPWVFEGSPVVSGGRVYCALSHVTRSRTRTALACFDATTGEQRWRQDICESTTPANQAPRCLHHLVTLADSRLVYCSHTGVVAALDPGTGRMLWAVRYSSRGATTAAGEPSSRGLSSCLYADGRLYVAPTDASQLICLDPFTGQLLWERELEVVDLFGVGTGRLVFTTTTPTKGLRAVWADSGADGAWPAVGSGLPVANCGRGLLAGDLVFWPTCDGWCVLNQKDGDWPDVLNVPFSLRTPTAPLGNMATADGLLAIADRHELSVFVSPGNERERLLEEAKASPTSAQVQYRLALAEIDTGNADVALRVLDTIESLTDKESSLRREARARRHELYLSLAQRAQQQRRWDEAAHFLGEAAGERFTSRHRLKAIARQADLWNAAQRPDRAIAAWQKVLDEFHLELRSAQGVDDTGNPQPGEYLAESAIARLIALHGFQVYESVKPSSRHLDIQSAEQSLTALCWETLECPNDPEMIRDQLELASLWEARGRRGAATCALRRFLRQSAKDDPARPTALRKLARLYEEQQCWEAAVHTWHRLEREPGEKMLSPELAEHVRRLEQKCGRTPSAAALQAPPQPTWSVTLGHEERLLPSQGELCSASDDLFFLRGQDLICRRAATGKICWEMPTLPATEWVGRWRDLVLVGGPHGLEARTQDDGQLVWRYDAPAVVTEEAAPFVRASLNDSRVFCLQGGRLLALDAETGHVLWGRWAPGGKLSLSSPACCFFPLYHADSERLVVQTSGGKLWVLDSATGSLLHETETSRTPWLRSPIALSDHRLCLVPDPRHVVLFDPVQGQVVWTHALDGEPSLRPEGPQVVSDGQTLLVIVARNFGDGLIRLNPQTGQALWPAEIVLGAGPVVAERLAVDRGAVFVASGHQLSALSLDDGRCLWRTVLPSVGSDWLVRLGSEQLVCCPAAAPAQSWRVDSPLGCVKGTLVYPPEERAGQGVPLVFADPRSGKIRQRCNLLLDRIDLSLRCEWGETAGLVPRVQFQRSISGGSPPSIRWTEAGLVVVVLDKAWGILGEN
jgi:outer membrane protein assembly factor BamB/tetratricopeptide (TPR) repeat protein